MKSIAAVYRPEGQPLHPAYRPDIDGLRAVAILSVLAFHAWPKGLQGGFVGVDIFFVISGYLITGIIAGNIDAGRFSLREFYGRRIRRIFPALLLVLAATLILGGFILFPVEYGQLGWHTVMAGIFSSNLQLWSETGYFDPGAETKPLLHLWSLGIEEQFYLLWPVLLIVFAHWRRSRGWIVAGVGLASFAFNMGLYKFYPSAAFYMPFTRFWELLIGAWFAVLPDGWITARLAATPFGRSTLARSWPHWASLAGFALIGVSLLHSYPGLRALAPTMGAALIIAAGPSAWLNRHLLASKVAVYVGLISYPLYLWHWPLLSFLHVAELEDAHTMKLLTFAALALSFALAALTYHGLERRLRHAPLRRVVQPLLAAMAVVMLAGGAVLLARGLPQRFAPRSRAMIDHVTSEQDARGAVFREGSCFLRQDQKQDSFAPQCAGGANPTVLVWGDSHAAHLYSGLNLLHPGHTAQYTAIECPALLGFDNRFNLNCGGITSDVAKHLAAQKPRAVVLAGYWPLFFREPGFAASLARTIAAARANAQTVILVGPAVTYPGPQLRRATRLVGTDMLHDPDISDLRASDDMLRAIAAKQKIAYVSPVSALCRGDACRVFVPGSNPPALFAFDYGHLTRAGSSYYARTLIAPFLPAP